MMTTWTFRWIVSIALDATALLLLAAAAQTPPAQPQAPSSPAQPAAQVSPQPSTLPPIPPVPPVPSVRPGTPLTLLDALRRALEQNLQVRQAALQVAIARAQVSQAQAGLLPTATLGASYTDQTAPGASKLGGTINIPSAGIVDASFVAIVPGSATPPWAFRLNFAYLLYTGNALQDQVAIAQANLRGQQSAAGVEM